MLFADVFRRENFPSSGLPAACAEYFSILQFKQFKTIDFSGGMGSALIARNEKSEEEDGAAQKENRRSEGKHASFLKERLEAEFAKAVKSAKSYVGNPQRLQLLFEEATRQAWSMPREPPPETWPYFQAMLRLIRAYSQGNYRDVPESTLVVIIAAII
jgi:hypothetical protein